MVSRHQRLKENVLLRTLGASRRQLHQILVSEYASLGLLAAVAGTILAVAAAWALAHFVFRTSFALSLGPLLAPPIVVTGLTVITGLISSHGIGHHPPLETLREEAS